MGRSGIAVLAGFLALLLVAVFADSNKAAANPSDVQKAVSELDRTFVCPEDLPTAEAKRVAVEHFFTVLAFTGGLTFEEADKYRASQLKEHQCREQDPGPVTAQQSANRPSASVIKAEDIWNKCLHANAQNYGGQTCQVPEAGVGAVFGRCTKQEDELRHAIEQDPQSNLMGRQTAEGIASDALTHSRVGLSNIIQATVLDAQIKSGHCK